MKAPKIRLTGIAVRPGGFIVQVETSTDAQYRIVTKREGQDQQETEWKNGNGEIIGFLIPSGDESLTYKVNEILAEVKYIDDNDPPTQQNISVENNKEIITVDVLDAIKSTSIPLKVLLDKKLTPEKVIELREEVKIIMGTAITENKELAQIEYNKRIAELETAIILPVITTEIETEK